MYRAYPQNPMPYFGLEMQNPYFSMDSPYYPGLESQQSNFSYLCPGPMPMPCPGPMPGPGPMPMPCPGPMPGPGPMPCPGMYPPVEVQRMVREMLDMVRAIYEDECE